MTMIGIDLTYWTRRRIVKSFSENREMPTPGPALSDEWNARLPVPAREPTLYTNTQIGNELRTYIPPPYDGYGDAQRLSREATIILERDVAQFAGQAFIMPNPNAQSAWAMLVDLFATTNLPLTFIRNQNFQHFLRGAFPLAKIPNYRELRTSIVERAMNVRRKWMTIVGPGSVISLMTDGGLGAGKNWLGTVACAPGVGFHFWSLDPVQKSDSPTIAGILACKINQLTEVYSLRVGAIITDNAANEKAALNPEHPECVQNKTGRPLVRVACMSHTVGLMLKDWAQHAFQGRDLYQDLALIVMEFNRTRRNSHGKLTVLATTRWDSMTRVVSEIVDRHDYIGWTLQRRPTPNAITAFTSYVWTDVQAVVKEVHNVILWSENNETRLCHVWYHLDKFCQKLDTLRNPPRQNPPTPEIPNIYSKFLVEVVLRRRHKTCDEGLLILSHLMTRSGLMWFHQLEDFGDPPGPVKFRAVWSKQLVRLEIEPHLVFYARLLGADLLALHIALDRYLTIDPKMMDGPPRPIHPRTRDEDLFWDRVLAGWLETKLPGPYVSYVPLANIAKILINIPASESDVERLFSHMGLYFGRHAHNMADDLIEARLMCKLDGLHTPKEMIRGLNEFMDFRERAAHTLGRLTCYAGVQTGGATGGRPAPAPAWGPAPPFLPPGLQNRRY
jgi:hypothetical protein